MRTVGLSLAIALALTVLPACNSGHDGFCSGCLEFTQQRCETIGKAAGCDSSKATEGGPCSSQQPGGGNETECEFEGCDEVPDCRVGF